MAVLLAAVLALMFLGSVLAHEMAHAVTARRRGIPVRGITFFLFGGATRLRQLAKRLTELERATIVRSEDWSRC